MDINDVSAAKEAIAALVKEYQSILNTSNLQEAVALYATDGVFMAPHSPPNVGKQAIEAAYLQLFATVDHMVTINVDEIHVLAVGEWAFARTTCGGSCRVRATGVEQPDAVQQLFILQCLDGRWKIARYSFSPTGAV